MRALTRSVLGLALAVPALAFGDAAAQEANPAHAHIGHVAARYTDTPANRGLLATAMAEAAVAVEHAGLAAQDPDNLQNIKLHAGHVIHAIDPTQIGTGPGLGYGVKKAAATAIAETELAAAVPGVSAAVRVLSTHISTATRNALPLTDQVLAVARQIQATDDAARAVELVAELQQLTAQIVDGADGDANWREGGLRQADQRATLLRRAEGIAGGE